MTDAADIDLPAGFEEWDAERQGVWIAEWVASVTVSASPPRMSSFDRPGIRAWDQRALAGMKRLHEERMRNEDAYRRDYLASHPEEARAQTP